MSKPTVVYTNIRDRHGVADLLREVSKRNIALAPNHRKKKTDLLGGSMSESRTTEETLDQSLSDDSESYDNDTSQKSIASAQWGKDFFQKFPKFPQNPLDGQGESINQPRPFFRKLSLQQNRQQQQAGKGENDKRQEIKKVLERSQHQGREMLQKFSTDLQSFSNHVKTSLTGPSNAETAARVSETLLALEKVSKIGKSSYHSTNLQDDSSHSTSSFAR